MKREAGCCCGQLKLTCQGEPIRVSMCHCLACQQRTGSVFGVQARFATPQVSIAGQAQSYVRVGDSGNSVNMHFCPHCGSTVYWQFPDSPEFIIVAVGAFADPTFPAPNISIYETRRHPWAITRDSTISEHWD